MGVFQLRLAGFMSSIFFFCSLAHCCLPYMTRIVIVQRPRNSFSVTWLHFTLQIFCLNDSIWTNVHIRPQKRKQTLLMLLYLHPNKTANRLIDEQMRHFFFDDIKMQFSLDNRWQKHTAWLIPSFPNGGQRLTHHRGFCYRTKAVDKYVAGNINRRTCRLRDR